MACNCDCHASRDPEVADVKKQIEAARHEMKKGYRDEMNRISAELSAEREAEDKLQSELDAMTQSNGRTVMEAAELHRLLIAEREASRKLVEHLKSLVDGIDYASLEVLNGENAPDRGADTDEAYIDGAHVFFKLIGSAYPKAKKLLESYTAATPGHSPEGKTL